MKKHQLQDGMWCEVATEKKWEAICELAKEVGIYYNYTHNSDVVTYVEAHNWIYQIKDRDSKIQISPEEFIQRLKGEYEEPKTKETGPQPPVDKHEEAINPSHYKDIGIEPLEVIRRYKNNWDNTLEPTSFSNIVKYIMRSPFKGNKVQDLKKARVYLTQWIDYLESDTNP